MDTNNNGQATDDQELAQVLAGMNQQAADQPATDQPVVDQPVADAANDDGMQFEETGATPPALPEAPADTTPEVVPEIVIPTPEIAPEPIAAPVAPETTPVTPVASVTTSASPELESIKKDALEQLRPLVDKLDLEPQEKFDTLLLIIRSTDDQSLLTAANEAAKSIVDENKRAEALLDVIKEIDFFTHPAQ